MGAFRLLNPSVGGRDAQANGGRNDIQDILLCHNAARLYNGAMDRDVILVGELLAEGTDPNHADERGRLPLHAAALSGTEKVARKLLEAQADTNLMEKDGALPLQIAVWQGHTEVTKQLLKASARVNDTDGK